MQNDNAPGSGRKRAPNACVRCRQQKIKCSGNDPCEQCTRRQLQCVFGDRQPKVTVSRSFIDNLERQASLYRQSSGAPTTFGPVDRIGTADDILHEGLRRKRQRQDDGGRRRAPASIASSSAASLADQADVEPASESEEADPDAMPVAAEAHLINPLISDTSPSHIADDLGKPVHLGTSSNWSFGRRVLSMAYERVTGSPLPASGLLFQGSTYALGWDGTRSKSDGEEPILPTADFALYLINTVRFHGGQLYHLFDEETFMGHFHQFHQTNDNHYQPPVLWYIHYLLMLAFGRAFIARSKTGTRPPGAEFFVHAMKMLPDITFLYTDPVQAIEVLCCAALYFQCLDHRSSAYILIGQAARIALEQGLHIGMRMEHLSPETIERYRQVWWTVYVLDRQMSSLMGSPVAFADTDVSARLPSFSGSIQAAMGLSIQVRLTKAITVILQSVYGSGEDRTKRLLVRMKEAIRSIASANDERNHYFPLDLKRQGALSRLAAHLHLLHHQLLAETPRFEVSHENIIERRCQVITECLCRLGEAVDQHTTYIASAEPAWSASTLSLSIMCSRALADESFLPFDLEAAFSSAIVLCLANAVDASLLRDRDPWLASVYDVLDEMISRGNLIAGFHKSELQQLDANLKLFPTTPTPRSNATTQIAAPVSSLEELSYDSSSALPDTTQTGRDIGVLQDLDSLGNEWNFEDGMSGEQLLALADSLDFGQLDWINADITTF